MSQQEDWEKEIKSNMHDEKKLRINCGLSKSDANWILDFYARKRSGNKKDRH